MCIKHVYSRLCLPRSGRVVIPLVRPECLLSQPSGLSKDGTTGLSKIWLWTWTWSKTSRAKRRKVTGGVCHPAGWGKVTGGVCHPAGWGSAALKLGPLGPVAASTVRLWEFFGCQRWSLYWEWSPQWGRVKPLNTNHILDTSVHGMVQRPVALPCPMYSYLLTCCHWIGCW